MIRNKTKPVIRTFFLPTLSESFPKNTVNPAEIMLKPRKNSSGITKLFVMFFTISNMKRYRPKLPRVKTDRTNIRYFRLGSRHLIPLNSLMFFGFTLVFFRKSNGIIESADIIAAVMIIALNDQPSFQKRRRTSSAPIIPPDVSII